jgi:hypothetical protein
MRLRHTNRYDYVPLRSRADYTWPNGRRLAVYFALNLEHFSYGEGLGAELAPGGPQPDILNFAWRDLWQSRRRLVSARRLRCPAAADRRAGQQRDLRSRAGAGRRRTGTRADEIVGHGRSNAERQGELDEAAERALIGEATARLAREEGRPPEGWLGPWISHSQCHARPSGRGRLQYLLDWCMDDQPVWFKCRGERRILSVPYPQELNDIPAIVGRKENGSDFADMIVDQFDEMLELSQKRPLVMGVALHGLHRRPAASAAPSQARAPAYCPAARRDLAHDTGRHCPPLCVVALGHRSVGEVISFPATLGRKGRSNASVHRHARDRDQHLLAAADQPRELQGVGVLRPGEHPADAPRMCTRRCSSAASARRRKASS